MFPKVAVLMACYNGLKYLPLQLSSILQQADVSVDLYVYDDASSDGTAEYLKVIEKKNSNVSVCYGTMNHGAAAQSFLKLMMSVPLEYDFYSLADQDDIWLEDKLFSAINDLGKGFDFYSSDVVAFWKSGKTKVIKNSQPQKKYDFFFGSAGPGCSFVVTHNGFEHMVGFMSQNHEKAVSLMSHDWFIYFYARSFGFDWIVSTEPKMFYRQHDLNFTGANAGVGAIKKRFLKMLSGEYREKIVQMIDIIDSPMLVNNNSFVSRVRRFSILDRLVLLLNVYHFRRKFSDVLALSFFLIAVIK